MTNETKQLHPAPVERIVRPRTREELMAARWMLKEFAGYDNAGTVRTGKDWYNRYMLFPWERGSFELVA